jgi:hypothetical protein
VDAAARNVIENGGFGPSHGIGLDGTSGPTSLLADLYSGRIPLRQVTVPRRYVVR